MIKRVLLVAAIASLVIPQAWSSDRNERIGNFVAKAKNVLGQATESKPSGHGSYSDGHRDQARMLLSQVRSGMAENNPALVESALRQLPGVLESEPLRKECEEIADELEQERLIRERKISDEANSVIKKAKEIVRTAKRASDLDAILHELVRLQSDPVSSSLEAIHGQLTPTLQCVALWQDYLSASAAGKVLDARAALDRLIDGYNQGQPDFIPRSELLARKRFLFQPPTLKDGEEGPNEWNTPQALLEVKAPLRLDRDAQKITFEIKELDDLDKAVKALQDIEQSSEFVDYKPSIKAALEALLPFQRAYDDFKAGVATNIDVKAPEFGDFNTEEQITRVRAQLITLVLPRYLGLPAGWEVQPGDTPHDLLARVAADARTRKDYRLFARVQATQQLLQRGSHSPSNEQTQAEQYIAGENQEAAGQYSFAVVSYEKALATGTDIVPPKDVGERLAKIKAEHPEEFQRGIELYLSEPSLPPAWPGARGFNPRRMWGPRQPTPTPDIAVPASSPTSTPSTTKPKE